jgi:endonuclease/exonuclease/phosphatase family metal-dependent hydrolase
MALKVVTWNIAGSSVSCQAPSGFVTRDKLTFVVAEVLRWGADLVTLQECVSSNSLAGLDVKYVLVGAEWVDVQRSYVHLYARKGLGAEMVPKRGRWPGVLARLVVDAEALDVAAVHLEPGPQGAEERKRQLSAISLEVKGSAAVVLGDFNIRLEEEDALLECVAGRNASYNGFSWDPRVARYEQEVGARKGVGFAFDRIFFRGACWVECFLVGRGRHYSQGHGFHISDHFGLLGFVDVSGFFARRARGLDRRLRSSAEPSISGGRSLAADVGEVEAQGGVAQGSAFREPAGGSPTGVALRRYLGVL